MARDIAATDAYATSCREQKKIEMLFAPLKRILALDRLQLEDRTAPRRIPPRRLRRPEPPKARQAHPDAMTPRPA